MRRFGYAAIVLLLAGAIIGAAELFTIMQAAPSTLSLGAIWFRVHVDSLVGFQALIEQAISPAVWPTVQVLLEIPAWLLLIPPGLLLVFLCRPRGRG